MATEDEQEPTAPTPEELRRAGAPFTWPMIRYVQPRPAPPPWRLVSNEEGDIVHVVPPNDQIAHRVARNEDCVCGPTVSLADGHEECDHPDIWMHQHHALDGRELPRVVR